MTIVQPGPDFITQHNPPINVLNKGERPIAQYNGGEEISEVDYFDSTPIADLSIDVQVFPPAH